MFQTLALATDTRGVARLTLNRPDKHNALNAAMIAELAEAARRLTEDCSVRVVVLKAAGKTFCAGGDLNWMREQMEADRAARTDQARKLAAMLGALDAMPKPLLAEVQGPAYGGGVGLLSVCDIAVAAEDVTFALTETRLGLIPAIIGPYVLARIGAPAWRRNALSGRRFDAREARSMALIARIVPLDHLPTALGEEIDTLLACAPGAVVDAKALSRSFAPRVDAATIDRTIAALVTRWETQEARDGVNAFFDRHPPPWIVAPDPS